MSLAMLSKTRAIEKSWKLSIEAVLMTGPIIRWRWMHQENQNPILNRSLFHKYRNAKDDE